MIRWDLKEAQGLPEGMNKCLEVLFDVTHEIANEIQKQMGFNPKVLQHLQKVVRFPFFFLFFFL